MRAQLREWWSGRTVRERALLAVLGSIAAVMFVWLLAVRPLLDARAAAEARHTEAVILHSQIRQLTSSLAGAPAAPTPAEIRELAADAGLQPETEIRGEALHVRLPAVRSDVLFGWIESLEAEEGYTVSSLAVARNEDATLAADLVVASAS